MLALLLYACTTPPTTCREGTTLADDGHCYPPLLDGAPTIEDVIDGLPACEPPPGPATIDLVAGCAHGVCVFQTFTEMVEVLGAIDCRTTGFDARQVYCTWEDLGIDARFLDVDEDDVPDAGALNERIHLFRPSTASTTEGVGVDATLACFFDALGEPETLQFIDAGGTLRPDTLIYDRYGLRAYDTTADGGASRPDGYIDDLYLFGQ